MIDGTMMRPPRRAVVAVAVGSALFHIACAPTPRPGLGADTGVVREQIDSLWTGLGRAMVNADTAALSRYYADDASFAETELPTIRGRAALVSGAAEAFASMRYLESRFVSEITEFGGDRVFQVGTYRDVVQPTNQAPVVARGRVAAVVVRDSVGTWRVARLVVIRDSVRPLPQSR